MPDDALPPAPAADIRGALTITGQHGPMNIVPRNMSEAIEFARLMSKAQGCIRAAFRDQPGACLALSLQAWRWNADPFAVANKAFIVNDQVAYESQLIHAIVNSSPIMAKRLRQSYSGEGAKRRCKVTGWLRGEDEPFEYESPPVGDIPVKNSPLWNSDPDQQLFYFASRAWARRHVPEILLGIYTTDEIEGSIIDVTADRLDAHAAGVQEAEARKTFVWQASDHTGEVYDFRTPERAVEACRKILIGAAAIGTDTLQTAWENNEPLRETLMEAEYGSDASALQRLFTELLPTPDEQPAPDDPAQRPAAEDAVPPAPAAGRSHPENPAPGPQNERSATETPAEQRGEGQPPPAEHSASVAAAALPTQSAERHDPFWDRESLRLDPPERAPGKPDWKVWPALVLPRIRQAWSENLLTALYQDNADNLDAYASNFGSRPRDELVAEFDQARDRFASVD